MQSMSYQKEEQYKRDYQGRALSRKGHSLVVEYLHLHASGTALNPEYLQIGLNMPLSETLENNCRIRQCGTS